MVAMRAAFAHGRQVERVLWIVLLLNMAVAAAKFFYGLASGSASMQADGIHSVFDSLGNVIGLIGIAVAARPADAEHPYGHSKFETYGSLAIGVLLLVAAFEVGSGAVAKLASQSYTAQVTPVSFVVMVGTLAVNLGVTLYERRAGRRLHSEILAADAAHTLSDAFVSIGVIAGLAFVAAGYPVADPIMALLVTVAILFSAVSVFRTGLRTLSDHARIPSDEVAAAAEKVPGIRQVHAVRTRGTEAEVYCDMHVLVDPQMTVLAAHDLGDEVERAVKAAFPAVKEVLVHIEPDTVAERAEGSS
ncbi:cation diffusion facilitator family transporter [Adlercreutzia sp. R21]|uniref:cation diffusion facilitator family transporter n=1 Tax=Adlercreutzia wanghongyangiae TaxID=3111451 RepID=UPI002DBE6D8F|nr:cation diffusion facilitator family transporter [Adlercreutzia sp. R21]MEC4183200.1 cation diffusion facilitator family transporter [Adlercreutzia sp. R21]